MAGRVPRDWKDKPAKLRQKDFANGTPMMEWMAPAPGVAMRQSGDVERSLSKEPPMGEITTIGVDLAKSVFQLHGVTAMGRSRCAGSCDEVGSSSSSAGCRRAWSAWRPAPARITGARELTKLGHEVRLMPPS